MNNTFTIDSDKKAAADVYSQMIALSIAELVRGQ